MRKIFLLTFLSLSLTGLNQQVATRKDTLWMQIQNQQSDSVKAEAYIELIGWYYTTDIDSAISLANLALPIAQKLNNNLQRAYAYGWLAYLYIEKGMLDQSLEANLKAIESYTPLNDLEGTSVSYNNIGLIYMRQGDYKKALEFWEKSIAESKQINYNGGLGSTYGNIGYLCMEQGDYVKAVDYLMQSAYYNEIDSNYHGLGISYTNIGAIYTQEKKYVEAIHYIEKSLSIRQRVLDNVVRTGSYTNLGYLYSEIGDYNKAEDYYNQALEIALKIDKPDVIATLYSNKAALELKRKNPELAKSYSFKALEIARKIRYPVLLKKVLNVLVSVYHDLKLFDNAGSSILEIVDINNHSVLNNFSMLTEKEKEIYFNSLSGEYQKFYSFVLFENKKNNPLTGKVYNSVLQNKGFLLKSTTATRLAILDSGDSTLIKSYESWIAIRKELVEKYALGINDSLLEIEADKMERDLVKKSAVFSSLYKSKNIDWTDVKSNLKENEAAIEFIHFNHSFDTISKSDNVVYCALLVKSKSEYPEMIRLFSERDLKALLGNFPGNNLTYIENLYGSASNPKGELYKLIWEPLENSLNEISSVYISPSGLLHRVSFSVLSKDKNVFLCDRFDINMQSSTGQIVLAEPHQLSNQSMYTLFGGIDYNSTGTSNQMWTYLEGTKQESVQIKNFLEKKKSRVNFFTASSATEQEFKTRAGDSEILHIATHGFFYPDPELEEKIEDNEAGDLKFRGANIGYSTFVKNKNPLMRSGIVFAGANDVWNITESIKTEDGVLTAQEVAVLDLRKTALVVLSACETGLGDIKGTEGVYGLQRAFKMAGVRYIIMSLWKVPDKETAEFMTTFYKTLIKTKNIRTAFIATQKIMRAKYDPYYWSAFVLIE